MGPNRQSPRGGALAQRLEQDLDFRSGKDWPGEGASSKIGGSAGAAPAQKALQKQTLKPGCPCVLKGGAAMA